MNDFISLGIVIFSAIIYASLQLSQGTLLLLFHASLGRHIRTTTRTLVSNYIAGFTASVFLLLSSICFVLLSFSDNTGHFPAAIFAVFAALLCVLGLAVWLIYYRRGGSTELWLPAPISRFITSRASSTNNFHESFSLGVFACLAELPFSVMLFIVSALSILSLPTMFQLAAIILFLFISVLPLIIMRLFIRRGSSVATVQRWRVANKTFFRLFAGFGFIILGALIFVFQFYGQGVPL